MDIRKVKKLIELLEESGISELEISEGEESVRISRHPRMAMQAQMAVPQQVMHAPGKTLNFDLPITADSQPNVTVNAIFLKDDTLYQAELQLKVPPVQQQLQVGIPWCVSPP